MVIIIKIYIQISYLYYLHGSLLLTLYDNTVSLIVKVFAKFDQKEIVNPTRAKSFAKAQL